MKLFSNFFFFYLLDFSPHPRGRVSLWIAIHKQPFNKWKAINTVFFLVEKKKKEEKGILNGSCLLTWITCSLPPAGAFPKSYTLECEFTGCSGHFHRDFVLHIVFKIWKIVLVIAKGVVVFIDVVFEVIVVSVRVVLVSEFIVVFWILMFQEWCRFFFFPLLV